MQKIDSKYIHSILGHIIELENIKREREQFSNRTLELKRELKSYGITPKVLSRILTERQRSIEEVKKDNMLVEQILEAS